MLHLNIRDFYRYSMPFQVISFLKKCNMFYLAFYPFNLTREIISGRKLKG